MASTPMDVTRDSLRFRTGAALVPRLGAEQLKDDITAVIELVKNAYDADATIVRVEFHIEDGSQTLRVEDNGSGMTLDDLHSKWAWLATENKIREDRSPLLRRRRLGQKGVGRFAAHRLGHELLLRTRVARDPKVLQVRFDWDLLDSERELNEYEFPVQRKKPDALVFSSGSRLDVVRLRVAWTRKRMESLRSQLAHLIDPEATASDFKIMFYSPWPELNVPLENPLPGNETHRLEFEVDASGREIVRIFRGGSETSQTVERPAPLFGALRGRLRYFDQGLPPGERGRGGDPDADWNVGVRIFRDGCRVRPYGEPGPQGDWLQIYRTRYQAGSKFRLKVNYLEGSVQISKDENPLLRDTTSREGLDNNDEYSAFVEYVQEKVRMLSDLVKEEEERQERSRVHERYRLALDPLTGGLKNVESVEYRNVVEDSDRRVRKALRETNVVSDTNVRNAHWECLDCSDSWKVPKDAMPTRCREFSVGRDGKPSRKAGCGSTNIRRKENLSHPNPTEKAPGRELLDDVIAGLPALVSGIQLRPLVDWEMGENDEEAEVRAERRELAINGRHRAFRAADLLDGARTSEGTTLEALGAVGALTIHIIDAASGAWGRWHCHRAEGRFEVYLSRASELKSACLASIYPAAAA